MNAANGRWWLWCAAGVALGVCLASPARADDRGQKDAGKGKDSVIVIQLDLSKAPPGLVKQLLELSKSTSKEGTAKKDDDDDKKGDKKDDDQKKGSPKDDGKKSNIVQVDLNRLPPDLAKRLTAELAKSKGKEDKGRKNDDDDDDDKKKGGKKDGDDDDAKKRGKKKDD